ncbi:hypothetical protein P4O66_001785 [Electrophorus voltai]|uniref:Apoptosis inducing factor mitochondria associated 3 n=1 Tax=Electrophorus voltai TaxID=2609070 RepID=A0AAD9DS50_9TELE|nr:hypothetical protein P4O66_001785 [Electrophorus voltai]
MGSALYSGWLVVRGLTMYCALPWQLFEGNRVKFYMLNEVSEMRGHHGQMVALLLSILSHQSTFLEGSSPATAFLKQSGVHMDSKGFITVNKMMQTNADGVFAGGDVVTFPLALRGNKKVNIPHWQMAHVHGRVAALGMMGKASEIRTVPYFWSAMFGKSIRYAGYGEGFDDVIIQGDLDELKFVAFYTKSEEVIAVASMNYDPIVSRVAEVFGSGKTIKKRDVERYHEKVESRGKLLPHQGVQVLGEEGVDEEAEDEECGKEDCQDSAEEGIKAAALIIANFSPVGTHGG